MGRAAGAEGSGSHGRDWVTHADPGVPLGQGDAAAVVQDVPAYVLAAWRCSFRSRAESQHDGAVESQDCRSTCRQRSLSVRLEKPLRVPLFFII